MQTDKTPHMPSRHPVALAIAVATVLLLVACAGGAPAPSGTSMTATGDVIELEMTGSIQIVKDGHKVDSIVVHRGQAYTFRIKNSAGFAHDFHIGTDADLQADRQGLPGLGQYSSGTQEFSYTFEGAGPLMFGCTIPGHYNLMKGSFDIQP
jgi:uncharacterized cupredoxin-like copper-binding protein